MTKKEFATRDVATIATRIMFDPQGDWTVVGEHLCGSAMMTHHFAQEPIVAHMQAEILRQYPDWPEAYRGKPEGADGPAWVDEALAALEALYGPRMSLESATYVGPVQTLADMIDAKKTVH